MMTGKSFKVHLDFSIYFNNVGFDLSFMFIYFTLM